MAVTGRIEYDGWIHGGPGPVRLIACIHGIILDDSITISLSEEPHNPRSQPSGKRLEDLPWGKGGHNFTSFSFPRGTQATVRGGINHAMGDQGQEQAGRPS